MNRSSCSFRFDDLEGRTLLITGTTQGIGKAILPGLIDQGLNLVLVGTPIQTMRAIREQLCVDECRMKLYECDLADPDAVKATARQVRDETRALDGLLHNAAIDPRHRFDDNQPELWQRVLQVNLHAPVTLTQHLLPKLRESSQGRVIFVGSVMAGHGGSYMSAYVASKGALESVTRSLAHELKGSRITVNCLIPGAIRVEKEGGSEATDARLIGWQAVPRRLTPCDLLGPISLLLSGAGSGITGQSLIVDGGLIHPLADRATQQHCLETTPTDSVLTISPPDLQDRD
ncbi:MAG TPA: SDR family NAD(P)-dependent oxidoreductase [Phycisphaeraceae bacterium]